MILEKFCKIKSIIKIKDNLIEENPIRPFVITPVLIHQLLRRYNPQFPENSAANKQVIIA